MGIQQELMQYHKLTRSNKHLYKTCKKLESKEEKKFRKQTEKARESETMQPNPATARNSETTNRISSKQHNQKDLEIRRAEDLLIQALMMSDISHYVPNDKKQQTKKQQLAKVEERKVTTTEGTVDLSNQKMPKQNPD